MSVSRRYFLGGSLALLGSACLPKKRIGSGVAGAAGGGADAGVGGNAGGGTAGGGNGDVFGYQAAFERELARIGEISSAELARMHPAPAYLAALTWDPTQAKYFAEFQRQEQFKLDKKEVALLKKHGFVVTGRLAAASFAELYYRVFTADLPVFISADSVLHAWHRSYDAILEEIEDRYLMTSLDEILAGMTGQLASGHARYGAGVLAASVGDADTFLAVARSLLADRQAKGLLGGDVDKRVGQTLAAVRGEQMQSFELFGVGRVVDFSQFKPRGHYEKTERLKRYFRAMMWLGRIDLRVGDDRNDPEGRQLGAAVVLHDLLSRSGLMQQWQDFDRLIQTFVGRTDSMTFAQLGALLQAHKITSPAAIPDATSLRKLAGQVAASGLGAQQIRSDTYESSPLGPDKAALPKSFTVMGQKFVVDSWVTGKIVADEIFFGGAKVQRRMPSALDVGFAALGNDAATPFIVKRIDDDAGVPFRDGLPFQHNLAAARAVIDSHPAKAWEENLYMGWLGTLRALSAATVDQKYPQAVRTQAWAMRTLNTQLSSWAQLRHDTILYVKQSYTAGVTCFYPEGFVDPRPEFWKAFTGMARRAEKLIRDTPYPDRTIDGVKIRDLRERQAVFFGGFAAEVDKLRSISEKQLACSPLTEAETRMLKDVVQISHGSGFTEYNGWYPTLFYAGAEEAGKEDFIIADVHTDVPAPAVGDPGGVLHQGIGRVDLMMVALESGDDRVMYAGPTMSHYEHATTGVERLADSDWSERVDKNDLPARPDWTAAYLVP